MRISRSGLVWAFLFMGAVGGSVRAGTVIPPPPTVWESATPVGADGWLEVDIPYAIVRHRLLLCEGPILPSPKDANESECHQPGTVYTKPTFFEGGHLIPGPVVPFLSPQQYLDKVAARHPQWHQRLTFSALAVSHSNYGGAALWLFYRVTDTATPGSP